MRGSAPQFQGGFGGDWFDIGDAPNTVCAEEPSLRTHVFGFETLEGGAPCSNCGGFLSTFLLMRYHRAPARIRQVTFGLQSFVSISLMRLMVKQQLAQAPPKFINTQIAFKNAIVAN